MARYVTAALLAALVPVVARTQPPTAALERHLGYYPPAGALAGQALGAPEELLPAGTQVYVRWDGIDAHRDAYARTALGKVMQGDTGRLLSGLMKQAQDSLGALLTVEQLLQGVKPERLRTLLADAGEAPKLLEMLGRRGFLLAGEVTSLDPPRGQVTLIVPGAGARPGPLFGAIGLITGLTRADAEPPPKAGETAQRHVQLGPVHLSWWVEGPHAVVVLSSEPLDAVRRAMRSPRPKLTSNPLFRRLAAFRQFETSARGYIDVAALAALLGKGHKEGARLLEDLGLTGVGGVCYHLGFDGEAGRSLLEVDTPRPRKGLLRLMGGAPLRLADLPPLPADCQAWSMTNFDLGALFDLGVQTVEDLTRFNAPADVPMVRESLRQANLALGVDVRADLLGALGPRMVLYSSPGEGPLVFGQVALLQVRDAAKLRRAIDGLAKGLGRVTGVDVAVKKRHYRGAEVRELHVRQQGFFVLPTYAIHNGWLVLSLFPQPVHGYLLRASGELPAWQPDRHVRAVFDRLPKDCVAVSVADPRPGVRQLLALAPLVAGTLRSIYPDAKLDVGAVPNSEEVNRHLFPNVTLITDDGRTFRKDSRSSLDLPVTLGGVDALGLLLVFSYGASVGL